MLDYILNAHHSLIWAMELQYNNSAERVYVLLPT